MKLSLVFRILFLATSLLFGAALGHAQDLRAVKVRIEQRVGAVDELKSKGLVGENNRGYLEARASLAPEQQKTVSDENSDRETVYRAIAQKNGSTMEDVGRARAQKIAISSKRRVWIQAPDGSWSQKG